MIRVEKVRGGEDRHLVPVTEAGDGAFYLPVNRGKRGMTLNPRAPEGRHVLRRLVATVDGTLAALLVRRDTGQGQHVRGSLLASALTIANGALLEQAVLRPGRVATPRTGRDPIPDRGPAPGRSARRPRGCVVQSRGGPVGANWANCPSVAGRRFPRGRRSEIVR